MKHMIIHFLWEGSRVAPDIPPEEWRDDEHVLDTPGGVWQYAGSCAMYDLTSDAELASRLRGVGIEQSRMYVHVVDADSEAPNGHTRYRRRGDYLEVRLWLHDDLTQETPEAFRTWLHEKIRNALETWLRKKPKRVA
jgi:hypothetical protein